MWTRCSRLFVLCDGDDGPLVVPRRTIRCSRMPRLRIVLVEPREAGNVGAAARVMKNFGHDDLWIVGDHPELLPVSSWWASGADDLLANARFAPSLQEAIGDAQLTV